MHTQLRTLCTFIAIIGASLTASLQAQEKSVWLDDQTVVVARLSVEKPTLSTALLDMLAEAAKPVANELKLWKDQLTSISQTVQDAGGKELLIVYSMADSFDDQPLLVVPSAAAVKLDAIRSTFLGNGALNPFRNAPGYKTANLKGDSIIGTAATLSRLGATSKAALQLNRDTGDNILSLTASLNNDQRRAVSEMATALPAFLGDGKVSDLLTEIESVQVDVTKSQNLVVTLTGKTAAIEARLKAIQMRLTNDEQIAASARSSFGKYLVDRVVDKSPQRGERSLTWSVPLSEALKSELGLVLGKAMLESDQMTAMQRIKTLGLALHNHESAFKKLPSVMLPGNKPRKLSWRVDLLPFLGYEDLWKEFHRDEPWDSEQNKKLIPRMPDVFRCPQSEHAPSTGLSTFVLPVNEKAMWSKSWQTEFKGIEDGTSNTIMTVEVRDELAQIWTKPDPFEVDLAAAEKQLGGHFEGKILFGAGDGSASALSQDKFNILPALLTRSGGEVVDW